MLKPENRDVAFRLAFQPFGARKMAINCRTIMFWVAVFDLEPVC